MFDEGAVAYFQPTQLKQHFI